MIELMPTKDLERIALEANVEGGEYEAARALVNTELARRALIITSLGSVDEPYLVPKDPQETLQCDSCQ